MPHAAASVAAAAATAAATATAATAAAAAAASAAEADAPTLATSAARSLCRTLRLIRAETDALAEQGRLAITADDLLGAAGSVRTWIDELRAASVTTAGERTPLPRRELWELQHVAYAISALLVWVDGLHAEGRLDTALPTDALLAWAEVEAAAGMPGRTAAVLLPGMDLSAAGAAVRALAAV